MFSLNQIFSFVLTLVVSSMSFAQTDYESPHVIDGKTIQFTLPKAYFEVEDVEMGQSIVEMFTTEEKVNFGELVQKIETLPALTVMHLPANENSLESMLTMVVDKLAENEITEIETPSISEINGRDVMLAAAKGEIDGQKMAGVYVSAMAFGDYIIMISYSAAEGIEDVMKYKNFKKIISSWKEIETEKENQLIPEEEDLLRRDSPRYYEEEGAGESVRYRDVPPPPPPAPVAPPKVQNESQEEIIED